MRSSSDRGSITAEFAVVLPAVLLVLVLCVGASSVSVQRIEAESAAAAAARVLARGDGVARAAAAVERAARGGRLSSSREGDFVCATVSARARFAAARVAGVSVSGRACALSGSVEP